MKGIAEGHSGRESAAMPVIRAEKAKQHSATILEELGSRDRVDLMRYPMRIGLTEP